jgi:hypothetical protein
VSFNIAANILSEKIVIRVVGRELFRTLGKLEVPRKPGKLELNPSCCSSNGPCGHGLSGQENAARSR